MMKYTRVIAAVSAITLCIPIRHSLADGQASLSTTLMVNDHDFVQSESWSRKVSIYLRKALGTDDLSVSVYRHLENNNTQPADLVTVEVVMAPDYDYFQHDLIDLMIDRVSGNVIRAHPDADPAARLQYCADKVDIIEFRSPDDVSPRFLYNVGLSGRTRGYCGWVSTTESSAVCVVMHYYAKNGLPLRVIEEYMALHPSTLSSEPVDADQWHYDDLKKWRNLLEEDRSDHVIQQAAAHVLRHLDEDAQKELIIAMTQKKERLGDSEFEARLDNVCQALDDEIRKIDDAEP